MEGDLKGTVRKKKKTNGWRQEGGKKDVVKGGIMGGVKHHTHGDHLELKQKQNPCGLMGDTRRGGGKTVGGGGGGGGVLLGKGGVGSIKNLK